MSLLREMAVFGEKIQKKFFSEKNDYLWGKFFGRKCVFLICVVIEDMK
jgi:hypothetical protein